MCFGVTGRRAAHAAANAHAPQPIVEKRNRREGERRQQWHVAHGFGDEVHLPKEERTRRDEESEAQWRLLPLWASLVAGVAGFAYLLLAGILRALRRRLNPAEPLFIPFLASVALFLPAPLFFSQSFLQLGDPTPASLLLALVTGILPVAMLYGLWCSFWQEPTNRSAPMDRLALLGLLQWSMVLAYWRLVPLRLWV